MYLPALDIGRFSEGIGILIYVTLALLNNYFSIGSNFKTGNWNWLNFS